MALAAGVVAAGADAVGAGDGVCLLNLEFGKGFEFLVSFLFLAKESFLAG